MKPNWHKASVTLFGDGDAGEVSGYFDYNLESWLAGIVIEIDESWYEFSVYIGPFQFSVIYWRVAP